MNTRTTWIVATSILVLGAQAASGQSPFLTTRANAPATRHSGPKGYFKLHDAGLELWRQAEDPPAQEDDVDPSDLAADAPPEMSGASSNEWHFTLSPYVWMMSLSADADIGSLSTSADVCFSELVPHMNIGAQLRFEAFHGPWGFYLDGTYVNLEADARAKIGRFRIRGVGIDVDITDAWLDFGGMYRFGERGRSFDIMVGGRYSYIAADLSIGPFLDVEESENYLVPVIGGRVEYAFTDKWGATLKGDVGGFGVGNGIELTWGVTGQVNYQIKHDITLYVGYRFHAVEFSSGSLDADLAYYGPVIGMAYHF